MPTLIPMLMELRSRDALLARLEEERHVWVRLAVNCPADRWQLSLLEVTLSEPPPGWRKTSWNYERARFVAVAPAGAAVARWVKRGQIRVKPISLEMSVPDHQIQVERRQSRFHGIFEPLPWPVVEWRVQVQDDQNRQMLHGELVAADAPAFLNFDHAAAAFFQVGQAPGGRNFSGCEFMVRDQDRRARVDAVRVRPSEVVINVSGDGLAGTMVTLGGVDRRSKPLRHNSKEARFPLPGQIPAGSWIALHRGQELLDRRGLDPTWGASDVELEVDPVTEVEVLVRGGEGATTEFKRQLPSDEPGSILTVMKTIAAFANGIGGTVLFGVEDDGAICGIGTNETRGTIDRLTSLIRDRIRPLVDFEPALAEVDAKRVLIIRVEPGPSTPYGVGTTDRSVQYYVRRGGTTFPATPTDIRAKVQARLPTQRHPLG